MLDPDKLLLGDCRPLLDEIPPSSVDLVLADLPYEITALKWDKIIPPGDLWPRFERILKPAGAVVLFGTQPFTTFIGASKIEWLRYSWVWEKNRPTNHLNAKKQPMTGYEDILVFYRQQPTYNPQGLVPFRKKMKNSHVDMTRGKGAESSTVSGFSKGRDYYQEWTNYPRGILPFDVVRNPIHPTEKPVPLLEYLVRTYTNAGDVVVDCCVGSGATVEACLNAGRRFYAFEQDEQHFRGAEKRIANYILTLDSRKEVAA